jgi:hypothetical protein
MNNWPTCDVEILASRCSTPTRNLYQQLKKKRPVSLLGAIGLRFYSGKLVSVTKQVRHQLRVVVGCVVEVLETKSGFQSLEQ